MISSLENIAADVNALAEKKECHDAASIAQSVYQAGRRQHIVVLAVPGTASIDQWIQQTVQDATVEVIVDFSSRQCAVGIWTADRVVLTFPCGALPTSELLKTLADGPFLRSQTTYAVVLTGAEQISSADDVKLVERTVLRWLFPTSSDGVPPASLRAAGSFLWADNTSSGAILNQVIEDRIALANWLSTPLHEETIANLDLVRLKVALNMIDAAAPSASTGQSVSSTIRVSEELDNIRNRVLSRFKSSVGDLDALSRLAVDELEADLNFDLGKRLVAFESNPSHPRDLAKSYCREHLETWSDGSRFSAFIQRTERITRDLDELIRDEDWSALSTISGVEYPSPLLRASSLPIEKPDFGPLVEAIDQIDEPGQLVGLRPPTIAKAAGTAIVTPLIALGVGLGPIGTVVATGVVTAATIGYGQANQKGINRQSVENYLKETFALVVRELRDSLTTLTNGWSASVRQNLLTAFETAEDCLRNSRRAPSSSGTTTELRMKLTEIETQRSVNSPGGNGNNPL